MTQRRALKILLLTAMALATASIAARADEFDNAQAVEDASLSDMRGGFMLDNGLQVGLGAVVRTTIDGELALQTQLTWTETGAVVTRELGAGVTPATPGSISGTITLPGATDDAFYVNAGETALIHRVTDGRIQNILLNTASGQDIRQQTEVTVTLSGYEATQQLTSQQQWGRTLGSDLAIATQGATR